jgi:hypothetical protein
MAQIQWLMWVSGCESVDYVVFNGSDEISIVNVLPNKKIQRELYWYGLYFWKHVEQDIELKYFKSFKKRL